MNKQKSEIRYDRYGPIRKVGTEAEGWVMIRRPHKTVFVIRVREWEAFSRKPVKLSDFSAPMLHGSIVLT